MYAKRSIYDLIVPRLLTEKGSPSVILCCWRTAAQCQNCEVCTYPDCGFGQ